MDETNKGIPICLTKEVKTELLKIQFGIELKLGDKIKRLKKLI